MLTVYINYPNPKITVHPGQRSAERRKHCKPGQRVIEVNEETISSELTRFREREYRFNSQSELNDMWIDIDFNDPDFEIAVVSHIRKLIGRHYEPLEAVGITIQEQ
jgi:hypothetical protein